jgi:hypothetical protein
MHIISPQARRLSALCLLRLLAVSTVSLALPAQAEIYKWVDASGKTHYTENKDEAGKGKAEQVKIQAQPSALKAPASRSWQDQEQESKQRLAQQQLAQPSRSAPPSQNQTESYGRPNSDAGKCNLARDVISGRAVRDNFTKTDANDRAIAASDIALFCK